MNVPFNDLKREYRSIKAEIDAAIKDVIERTAFIKGAFLVRFEENLAAFCETEHAVGTSSGTTALHAALLGFDIGPGDEVITVSHTFIGTAEPISHAGAKPVFVDITSDTYTLDPYLIEAAITPRTRAIIPVHLYGQMADMEAIRTLARTHKLVLIEDAAQAIGARLNGHKAGFYGDAACFSFYPGKNLGAYGDAGAVITNDAEAAHKIRMIVDHGRVSKYLHESEGFNYRLDALQAAILDVKLRRIDAWNEKRREIAEYFSGHLKDLDTVLPIVAGGAEHVFHVYCILVKDRDAVQERLKELGVSTGVHYPVPLHLQPAYRYLRIKKGNLPVTESVAADVLSLPIFPFMSDEEKQHVVDSLHRVLAEQQED